VKTGTSHGGVKEQAFCNWYMQHFHPHVDINKGNQLKCHVVLQLMPAYLGN
jgi:hypothetical protein